MIELNTIYGGPHIHKTERANPTEVLISLIDENPNADRDTMEKEFIERVRDDEDYLIPIIKYFFLNAWNGLHTNRRKAAKNGKAAAERKAEIAKAAEVALEKVKRALVLDLILPTGKKARESTFADCKKAGGFWAKIAAKGKPGQIVGKVLSDEQAQAIWAEKGS